MTEDLVQLRGTREGIHVHLDDEADFRSVIDALDRRLAAGQSFFSGAKIVINMGQRLLSGRELGALAVVLARYEGMHLARLEQGGETAPGGEKRREGTVATVIEKPLRSGQQLFSPGHIVIIGDVNPGAEVIAEGNIVVMGALRGVAHAGYAGDKTAFVAANIMVPSQVGIAGVLARQPDGDGSTDTITPEIARLREGQIIILPCQRLTYN